jgi:type IV pilus assembly protein PilQ
VKNNYDRIGILTGVTLLLLTAQPLRAANTQAKDTELNPFQDKVGIVLKTLKHLNIIRDTQPSIKGVGSRESGVGKETKKIAQNTTIVDAQGGQFNTPAALPTNVTPGDPNAMVPNPQVTIEDKSTVAQGTQPAPQVSSEQFLPRAVAPPVGDMAISNINSSPELVNLGSTKTVSRLVLKDAPIREVLSTLLQSTGLNLVFIDEENEKEGQDGKKKGKTISLDVQDEPVQQVFNSVLLASNLQANRQGNTVFVGTKLPSQARNLVSRTLRLNQVTAANAAAFLASQGAEVQRLSTSFEDITDPQTGKVTGKREKPSELKKLTAEQSKSGTEALLLKGLSVATDDRLNAITLIGEPRSIEMATSFLTQLDARRRQVAVNVKVVDVNLLNEDTANSSFSFGVNDSFFVQDKGSASMRFGSSSPVTSETLRSAKGQVSNPPAIDNPFVGANTFFDFSNGQFIPDTLPGTINAQGDRTDPRGAGFFPNSSAGVSGNPFQSGITNYTLATDNRITTSNGNTTFTPGTTGTLTNSLASIFQYPKKFLALLDAKITNGNAKILTDPTLVVQEGQQATVKLTQEVVKSVETSIDPQSGVRITTPEIGEAGLTLSVNLERVDDNGFIGLSVSPTVSAVGNTQNFDSGSGAVNVLSLLSKRELSSGLVRLRDGQTLVLSGIIQDAERTTVSKVPFLGDLPLLGSLFRSTGKKNERAEVVVLLTPQIMDDSEQSQWGFNYNPSKDARELLQKKGFTPQSNR